MLKSRIKRALSHFPSPVVDWSGVLYDFLPPVWRYGGAYRTARAVLNRSEWWTGTQLAQYQADCVRRLVVHCAEHVPYYRELFRDHGINPLEIQHPEDLHRIPVLTKEIVRKRKNDLIADNYPAARRERETTSGTTGSPLDFYFDESTRAMERALARRHLQWLGFDANDRIAELKVAKFADPNRLFMYYPASKTVKFAFFRVDENVLERIFTILEDYRPTFVKAFPSSLNVLVRWMEKHGKSLGGVRFVVTSSETLYPWIKDRAERVLGALVIDHYGQNENVAVAFQCTEADGYHIQHENNVFELLPTDRGDREIVGTCLHNYAMPFLRYRTGDLAEPAGTTCPCGRSHSLIKNIKGREGDFIITPERTIVDPAAIDYAFHHLHEIREARITQEEIGKIVISVVGWESISRETIDALRERVRTYVNSQLLEIAIEVKESIPPTSRGKKPFIVSRVNLGDYL